jgi:hypothetical protein
VTGAWFVYGPCVACRRTFGFNPEKVPSVIVDGQREPICQGCVDQANPERERNGLPKIVPLPGAYEPIEGP